MRHKLEGAIRDNTDALAQVLTKDPIQFQAYRILGPNVDGNHRMSLLPHREHWQEQGKTIADAKGDIFRGLEARDLLWIRRHGLGFKVSGPFRNT